VFTRKPFALNILRSSAAYAGHLTSYSPWRARFYALLDKTNRKNVNC